MSNDCNNNKHIDGYDCDSTKTYSIFMVMKFVKTLMVKLFPINNNDHNMGKLLNTNSSIRFDELFNFNPMASQLITSYQKKVNNYLYIIVYGILFHKIPKNKRSVIMINNNGIEHRLRLRWQWPLKIKWLWVSKAINHHYIHKKLHHHSGHHQINQIRLRQLRTI